MFDGVIPAHERNRYLLTHPISDTACYNVVRWTPCSQLAGKGIVISGKTMSNRGGNGISLKAVNWKDDRTPVVLNILDLKSEGKAGRTHDVDFVVRINPGDLGKNVDLAIGNNGTISAMRRRCSSASMRPTNASKHPASTSPKK
jgi:hypothetical protein